MLAFAAVEVGPDAARKRDADPNPVTAGTVSEAAAILTARPYRPSFQEADMKKKQIARKPALKARAAQSSVVPPLVVAVERFAQDVNNPVDPEFAEAWAFVPTLLRALAHGEGDVAGQTNRFDYVRERVEAAAAKRPGNDMGTRGLSHILAFIEEQDSDWLTTLQLAYSEPAFNLGLALGCALMANPSSLAINVTGGGR